MRILCIGNCTEDTDHRVTEIAEKNNSVNRGLISELDGEIDFDCLRIHNGYYHTSFVDLSFESVKKCVGYFDKLFVIDQPIHTWNTATEFYNTVNSAMQLDNVEWQNVATKQDFLYWKEQVKNNKSLCIWPFIQMHCSYDNEFHLCCDSGKLLDNTQSIQDFNNKTLKTIRQKMLDGTKLPEFCSNCYTYEATGLESTRQYQTVEWATRLGLKNINDLEQFSSPLSFEISLDNKCNLMCRMCDPGSSSLIEKEYKQLGLIGSDKMFAGSPEKILDTLLSVPRIEKLYITGGEPSANKHFYKFLQDLIEIEKTDFVLQINTNAHKISNSFLDLVCNFQRVEFLVSVDAFEKTNDYIRWNSNWNTLQQNIQQLIKSGATVSFNVSLSIIGIFSFYDLMDFLDSNYPNNYISFNLVLNQYPFMIEYDQSEIDKIVGIKQLSLYNNNNLLRNFVDNVIAQMKQSKLDKDRLNKFFTHNDKLDNKRGSKLVDYVPQLEAYRKFL